jgi:hypothetical protein
LARRAATMQLQLELLEQRFAQSADGTASRDSLETYQRVTNTLRRTCWMGAAARKKLSRLAVNKNPGAHLGFFGLQMVGLLGRCRFGCFIQNADHRADADA